MPHRCFSHGRQKSAGQRNVQYVSDGPTKCLVLDSLEKADTVPITCVADVHMPVRSGGQSPWLSPLTSLFGTEEGTLKTIHFWTGKVVANANQRVMAPVTALLMLPVYSLVWCGDEKGCITAFRFHLEKGSEGDEFCSLLSDPSDAGHQCAITCFAAGEDNYVYSGSIDGSLGCWRMQEPFEFIGKIGGHTGKLSCITCVRGDYLVSVGPDSPEVHVWPVGEKRAVLEPFALRGHSGGVFSCIHVDGCRSGEGFLWSAGNDLFIRLWELGNSVHHGCRIVSSNSGDTAASSGLSSRLEGVEESGDDDEGVGNDSMQDNSFRILAGHDQPVVALRASSGVVFSCDASGVFLAWNADRYRLLRAFLVPAEAGLRRHLHASLIPATPDCVVGGDACGDGSGVGGMVRGARCLGFTEGFLWVIDTDGGPRGVFMPGHPRLRKLLCDSAADATPLPSDKTVNGVPLMNEMSVYFRAAVNLLLRCVESLSECFTLSVVEVTRRKPCGIGVLDSPRDISPLMKPQRARNGGESVNKYKSSYDSCVTVNDFCAAREELERERALLVHERQEEEKRWCKERQRLEEESIRLESRAQALARLQANLIEAKLQQERIGFEREELIQSLKKRDRERERQLVRFSAELSFLRLKYGDWSCLTEERQ